ncbi:MAG TPA: ribosome assembly factor SBDS [Candidatus Nanoarchaeia archaeon]|nr:ribosome assembly factor SBDS [Candidatus Nanoarchaeia archaeon]
MTTTTARIKKQGKHFEVIVDLDDAMKFKKGESDFLEPEGDAVFRDSKKGEAPPQSELEEAFGTTEPSEVAKKIVKEGEVLLTGDYRDAEREKKFKQVVDFLSRNAINPQTGHPHTGERIKNALEQANVNIKNQPIESQISDIIKQLEEEIPLKLETKRIRINIPAMYTGKAYGVVNQYKEAENWQNDGSLEVTVNVPSGIIMDFFDKLNSVTHGAATTEELKE